MDEWITYLVSEYHRPLAGEVEALTVLSEWIVSLGQDAGLEAALADCREVGREAMQHAEKEELLLFPRLRRKQAWLTTGRLQVMTIEHHDIYELMDRIAPAAMWASSSPAIAVRTWGEAYLHFDRRLREHMRIEDEELFPRALLEETEAQIALSRAVGG